MNTNINTNSLNNLLSKLSSSQNNQNLAQTQTQIISFIISQSQTKLITNLNALIQKLSDSNFSHIFSYLLNDSQFLQDNQNQLILFLIDNLTICGNGIYSISKPKQFLIMKLLLNAKVCINSLNSYVTLGQILIEQKCRKDMNLCYSLYWNVNQIFAKLSLEQYEQFNLNGLSVLAMKVIKNYTKLPHNVVDEALKFISIVFLPKILNQTQQISLQIKQIIQILLYKVYEMIQSQVYRIGNSYRYLGLIIQNYKRFCMNIWSEQYMKMLIICQKEICSIFIDYDKQQVNGLQRQIQKMYQYYGYKQLIFDNNNQQQQCVINGQQRQKIKLKQINKINIVNRIRLNMRIQLLRGISYYLNRLYLFFINLSQQSQYQIINMRQIIIKQSERSYKKIFQLLSYCNDRQIFVNFIQVNSKKQQLQLLYHIQFNIQNQHLIKQIIRNCPALYINNQLNQNQYQHKSTNKSLSNNQFNSINNNNKLNSLQTNKLKSLQTTNKLNFLINNNKLLKSSQIQLNNVISCLSNKIQQFIQQGNLSYILQLIKNKIQKQYDQSFNIRQFQSASNTLTLVFKVISNKYNLIKYNKNINNNNQFIQNNIINQSNNIISQSNVNNQVNVNPQKQLLSKDQIIQWIKTLLNLNQSCLPKHRKLIVSKTYQLFSQVFNIILPGNQYLQEVIENQLITKSFPHKLNALNKLFELYQKHGNNIFQLGYINKSDINRYQTTIKTLLLNSKSMQQNIQENTNSPSQKNIITNSMIRKLKILQRIFTKMEQLNLPLNQRKNLWKLAIRTFKIGHPLQQLNLRNLTKLFALRPDILFARHLAAQQVYSSDPQNILLLSKDNLQKVGRQFKKYPVFYEEELDIFKSL